MVAMPNAGTCSNRVVYGLLLRTQEAVELATISAPRLFG